MSFLQPFRFTAQKALVGRLIGGNQRQIMDDDWINFHLIWLIHNQSDWLGRTPNSSGAALRNKSFIHSLSTPASAALRVARRCWSLSQLSMGRRSRRYILDKSPENPERECIQTCGEHAATVPTPMKSVWGCVACWLLGGEGSTKKIKYLR